MTDAATECLRHNKTQHVHIYTEYVVVSPAGYCLGNQNKAAEGAAIGLET